MNKKIVTTTPIIADDKKKIKEMCLSYGMKQYEVLHYMTSFFYKQNINPKEVSSQRELRDTFISFIRTQEKSYHIPLKNDVAALLKQQKNVEDRLSLFGKEIKFLFDYLKSK